MEVVNINQVKKYNVEMIKNALSSIPSGTKTDIAHITGLSVATCNTILNELAEQQMILEVQNSAPGIGRPARRYRFNKDYSYACCLYLERSGANLRFLRYAIADLTGNFIANGEEEYENITVEAILEFIARQRDAYPRINKISLGIPGFYHDHRIRSSGRSVLDGADIVKELYDRFHCDVYVENDMNATAFGIHYFRDDIVKPDEDMVLVAMFRENSLGAGTIINGKILRGHTYFAGELLHLPVPGGDPRELLRSGPEGVIAVGTQIVVDISVLINPSVIVFTGNNINEEALQTIRRNAFSHVSEEDMPRLVYKGNFDTYYLQGLAAIALDASVQSLSARYPVDP